MIHLGYETGTGKAVSIPLAHMAVTGMTQQSGKTVTMESLIDRGDLRAVVFVTKPGEKSFTKGRKILPFFKERADWEYVKELLEARRNESLSKWDGYLMRACRWARTLQDVRDNVEAELPKKKSARPSHYEVLAGYLDLIIPELERVSYTDKLELEHGVNIMDLTAMSDDMKNMVIRSTIEHIHKRERNTVLVVPEAWKFIPEGGRSAVFQALQALVREGATNGNFVWIDAQDLAIVSKRILKSVSVWVLGKQQEANEVARTINHLIEPLQIRPDMIKSLGIGQFLICADSHPARRVYVQPWWLGELDALAIARGEESVETAQAIFRQKKKELAAESRSHGGKDNAVDNQSRISVSGSVRSDVHHKEGSGIGTGTENGDVGERAAQQAGDGGDSLDGEETMWKEKYETLKTEHQTLIEAHDALAARVKELQDIMLPDEQFEDRLRSKGKESPVISQPYPPTGNGLSPTQEEIYRYVIRRAEEDPRILQILSTKRELLVKIEMPVLEVDGSTLRGGLALLIHKGFFSAPKNGNTAFNELQRLGRRTAKPNVYRELDKLAEMGFLTKEDGGGYQSTDLKVTVAK